MDIITNFYGLCPPGHESGESDLCTAFEEKCDYIQCWYLYLKSKWKCNKCNQEMKFDELLTIIGKDGICQKCRLEEENIV